MIELKKSQLEPTLLTISAYDSQTGKLISGLLKENITIGVKRKLQEIHREVLKEHKQFLEDFKQIKNECGDDLKKLENEVQELLDEVVKIQVSTRIPFSLIENVSTENNYNLDIIEKITY